MTNILQSLTFVNYATILYEFKQIQIVTKARRRGGRKKKISINLTSCSFFIRVNRIFFSLSFFFSLSQKVNQTNACNVRLSAPDSYRRNVVEWSSKTIEKYFAVSIPSIYIYISRVSISSYRARTRLLRISRHSFFFHFYFLVKSNNDS